MNADVEIFRRLCAGEAPPPPDKRVATLKARLALKGVELNDIEGDYGSTIYVVSHGYLTREFQTIELLASWTDMVTGVRG